jgi:hypothetical protein
MPLSSSLPSAAAGPRYGLQEQLRHYRDEVARLRVENEQLRRSAQAFGELAERLNLALKQRDSPRKH